MEKLKKLLKEHGIEVDDSQAQLLIRFYEMLVEKNKVMNLTAITGREDVFRKHFLDSLILEKYTDLTGKMKVIDVGTGAGFPGIPLAIVHPNLSITLMDSLNKRIGFLNEVTEELKLTNVTAVHSRAEDLGRDRAYRQKFDLVVSRAVANLSVLCEYCLPFAKVGGEFAAYKSGNIDNELDSSMKAIKILGGAFDRKEEFALSEQGEDSRTFIFIKKQKSTPGTYPRKAGTPSRKPL